ncbi:transglutaminase-like domain-containing protein [Roseisalinus antarcticus]|uniref:Transglutaminase-like superfamily protein n=1 Tax=Roseisalinus antarcticus TaxID=254357 RepID=A0A1Y5T2U8_9RHOB|nr:transglutaminase family protein [Roseisalinus antarcticus]SLN52544.1 Transglutaminase-like superfamily protein [Roseisalinus antarcticus]
MRISIEVTMTYRFPEPNTVFFAIEAADYDGQTIEQQRMMLGEATVDRIAGDSGVGQRIWARVPGNDMELYYTATIDVTRPAIPLVGLEAMPLHRLPAEVVPYLRPSRYCQSDKFIAFVNKRFGHLQGGAKIAAMRDWIEAELSYVPGSSDADTNVLETFAGRQGVCRDYAHLFCTMARAAQIPARAVAAYGADVVPPDFHAVAEVWLGDAWHLVDPTGMCQADGLAVVAVGRDAYDIAFMESQAPAELITQIVNVARV